MRAVLSFVISLLAVFHVSAQYNSNQNKNWVFGNGAGLSFATGSPVAFTSAISAPEGCASVSDNAGNLLFYTNGKNIWNRNGAIMPNGAAIVPFATASTSQGTVIVPVIGNADRYYVFSLEQSGGVGTLAYTVVDMTLNGGLGDVAVPAVTLATGLNEMMAVAPAACGAWLLTHKKNQPRFEAFQITNAGVATTPVESLQGNFANVDSGVIKFDPSYRRIVMQAYTSLATGGGTDLYSFNSSNGIVFSGVALNSLSGAYGAEFSASGSFLYAVYRNGASGSRLLQYNITTGVPTFQVLATSAAGSVRDLKLAPDGKIYFPAFSGADSLDRIGNPDVNGIGCSYSPNAVSVGPGTCTAGLPNTYVYGGLSAVTGAGKVCVGGSVTLHNATAGGTWSSSNTGIATVNTTTGIVTGVTVGSVIITYTRASGCYTTWPMAVVASLLTANTGALNICQGNTTTLVNATTGGIWSSSGTSVVKIDSLTGVMTGLSVGSASVTYSLGGGCIASSLVNVGIAPVVDTIAGPRLLCAGSAVTYSCTTTGGSWSSSDNSVAIINAITGEVTPLSQGRDTIRYTKGTAPCAAIATKVVTVNFSPDAGTISGKDTICNGATVTLSETITGGIWSTDDSSRISIQPIPIRIISIIKARNTGSLNVFYTTGPDTNGCYGRAVHKMHLLPEAPFIAELHPSPVTCYGGKNGSIYATYTLNGPYTFTWSNLATTPDVYKLPAGPITLKMEDTAMGCFVIVTDTIRQPDSIAINPTVTHDRCAEKQGKITLAVSGGTPPYTFSWLPTSTQQDLTGLAPGFYSVTVTDDSGCINSRRFQVLDAGCGQLTVPDVITPNGDGANDEWVITGIQYYPRSSLQVYDKWGDLVYDQVGYRNDWTGIGKLGAPLPDGTYFYVLVLNAPNTSGGPDKFTGTLFIKR